MSHERKGDIIALGSGWISFVYASVLDRDSQAGIPLTDLTADFYAEKEGATRSSSNTQSMDACRFI